MNGSSVVTRRVDESARAQLIAEDVHPLMARIFAARGIEKKTGLDTSFASLLPSNGLTGCAEAARLLADAIAKNERLLIVADYDADGATACSLGIDVLRRLGADVGYLVPNRFEHGYGLTPEIVELAAAQSPPRAIERDVHGTTFTVLGWAWSRGWLSCGATSWFLTGCRCRRRAGVGSPGRGAVLCTRWGLECRATVLSSWRKFSRSTPKILGSRPVVNPPCWAPG